MYSHQRTVQDWVVVDFVDIVAVDIVAVDIVAEEIHQGVALPEVETHPHKGYQGVGPQEEGPQEVHKIQEEVVMDMNSLQVEGGHLDTTQLEDHL